MAHKFSRCHGPAFFFFFSNPFFYTDNPFFSRGYIWVRYPEATSMWVKHKEREREKRREGCESLRCCCCYCGGPQQINKCLCCLIIENSFWLGWAGTVYFTVTNYLNYKVTKKIENACHNFQNAKVTTENYFCSLIIVKWGVKIKVSNQHRVPHLFLEIFFQDIFRCLKDKLSCHTLMQCIAELFFSTVITCIFLNLPKLATTNLWNYSK